VNPPFQNVAIIGLGLIGSSIARAVRESLPGVRLTGYDSAPAVRPAPVSWAWST
jgi:cyclohexadieny/prephenate dehydrogenase